MIVGDYNLVYHTWKGLAVSSTLVVDLRVSLTSLFIQLYFQESNYSILCLLLYSSISLFRRVTGSHASPVYFPLHIGVVVLIYRGTKSDIGLCA
jgi:hypothetical protein